MVLRALSQFSFFHPEVAAPACLAVGTVPWLLARYEATLFPTWALSGWTGGDPRGRPAWPATVLAKLMVLRWSGEGMSRRASVREADRNIVWRAAMGLEIGGKTPSEKTVRKFERFLGKRHPEAGVPRYLLLHEHWVRLCLEDGDIVAKAVWAMDSTPMWCYGAVLDTVRLLGDGVRALALKWARLTRTKIDELAVSWDLPLLTAPSTKGAFRVDWHDSEARATVITEIATKVLHVVDVIRQRLREVHSGKRKWFLKRCRHLLKVISNDLETDEAGNLVVARRVARDRLISMTDPHARHGRKSKSGTFNGFKAHVFGDVVSGLIASVAVTVGNKHDGAVAHRLVRRAKDLCRHIDLVLADTAYGGARLRHLLRGATNVDVVAPPPPRTALRDGKLGRSDIEIDFDSNTATCAAGVQTSRSTVSWSTDYDAHFRIYKWPKEACDRCSRRKACRGKQTGGHRVPLHPFEEELRAARDLWRTPGVRDIYRARSQCERLVNQITRHGGRRARAWGIGAARMQVHLIAMSCNLAILARRIAAAEGHDQPLAAA